jgi:L-iditol 2-dehydrogenase
MYQRHDYMDAIRCLAEGGVTAQPLLSVSFPFRRYLEAYQYIEANRDRVMKVMIDLDA